MNHMRRIVYMVWFKPLNLIKPTSFWLLRSNKPLLGIPNAFLWLSGQIKILKYSNKWYGKSSQQNNLEAANMKPHSDRK